MRSFIICTRLSEGPPKRWYPTTSLHRVTTQKIADDPLKRWCPTPEDCSSSRVHSREDFASDVSCPCVAGSITAPCEAYGVTWERA
jgi:hypothetical protein